MNQAGRAGKRSMTYAVYLSVALALSLIVGLFAGTGAGAQTTNFRGIYEFAGNNSATDATDPDLAGVVLNYYWSQIEPEKGVFDWSLITERDGAVDRRPQEDHPAHLHVRCDLMGCAVLGRRDTGVGVHRRRARHRRQRRDDSRLLGPGLSERLRIVRGGLRCGVRRQPEPRLHRARHRHGGRDAARTERIGGRHHRLGGRRLHRCALAEHDRDHRLVLRGIVPHHPLLLDGGSHASSTAAGRTSTR